MFKGKENSSHRSLGVNGLYRAKTVILLIIAGLAMSATASAATYYLNAGSGNDNNDGSINSPWKTINRAKTLGGGNTVIVADGKYGQFFDSKIRSDWLTFKAAPGAMPQLDRIFVGKDGGGKPGGFSGSVYLRFDGFLVKAPVGFNDKIVKSRGGNYFQVLNCKITGSANPAGYNAGYWDLNHGAVWIVANHIKIHHCDISNALRGIELKQSGFPNVNHVEEITNNYIHDCAGSGIYLFEQARAKIEYNHVYRQQPYKSKSGVAQHGSGIGVISPEVSIRYNIVHSYGNSGGINYYTVAPWDGVNTNAIIENNLIYDSGGMRIAGIKSGCKINNNTTIGHADANGTELTTTNERRYVYGSIGLVFHSSYVGDLECYNNLVLGMISNNKGVKINAGNNIVWDYEYPSAFRYSHTALPNSIIAHPNYSLLESGMFVQDPIDFSWPQDQWNQKYCNQLFQDFHLVEGAPAINFGLISKQTAKGLGSIGPDGFIQDDGIARDSFHHSAGAYEFGPAQPGAPRLEAIGNKTGNEDEMISFTLIAADPEGDKLTFSSSPLPSGAILDTLTGDFAWIPSIGQAGQYEITFTVSDGSQTDSETTNITIYPKDVFPPEVTSVMAAKNSVAVMFNEPVDPQSAEDIANYSITNGITISAAAIDPEATVVVLTTSDHAEGVIYTLTASDITDTKANTMTPMSKTYRYTNGLVGAWKFNVNNATSAEDLSGNGSTATIYGATWTGQNELSFDGLNDYVNCGSSTELNLTSSLTVSAWINPRTFGQANFGRIIDKGTSSAGFSLLIDGSVAALQYAVYGKAIVKSSPNVIDLNLWQHVAAAYDESAELVSFYVNGQPAGTAACTTNPLDSAANPLFIGIRAYDSNRAFDGLIDDVRTFNRALTDAEMAGLYSDGKLLFDPIGDRTVNENETLTINVATSTPSVTVTAQPLPIGSTFTDNTFEWTPAFDQAGTYGVDFIATDGEIEDIETVTITVNKVNRPPVMAPVSNMTVEENTLVSFSIDASDPDGDSVTITGDNLPAGSDLTGGKFNWTPTTDQVGDNVMSFIASDGELEDVDTVIITVNRVIVNTAPVLAAIGDKVVDEEQALSFGVTATDADGDALTISAADLPQGASLTNGTFTWTPAAGQAGTYDVTVTVTDGTDTDSETITITVNALPVQTFDLFVSTSANRSNPVDLDGAVVTSNIYVFVKPETGIAQVEFYLDDPTATDRMQRERYAPYDLKGGNDATANPFDTSTLTDGTHTLTTVITLANGTKEVISAEFTVDNFVNTAPVLDAIGDKAIDENSPLTFDVTASDVDGDALTLSAANLPQGASFADGTFAWTPAAGQAGTYTVTFTVTDGVTTDSASVAIVVSEVIVEVPKPDFDLMVSFASNRSGAVLLDEQAVSGDIFVFVTPASGISQVEFFIDDADMTSRVQLERAAPYDLKGGNDAAANAFDTTQLADGDHTMSVKVKLSDGTTQIVTAGFTVKNEVAVVIPAGFDVMVSYSSNRSNAVSLNGQDVSGKIYVFFTAEKSLSKVRFYLDDPAMTSSPMQTESWAPYDLRGGSKSNANAFDTGSLANGAHTLTVEALLSSGGTEIVTVYFTK